MAEYFKNFEGQKTYTGNSQETEDKPKKFVFQIYPENIDYVDSLSYEEKHDLINQLLANYRDGLYTVYDPGAETKKIKKIVIGIILLLVIVPIFFYFLNVSLNATKTNYRIFQGGFEKLFNKSQY